MLSDIEQNLMVATGSRIITGNRIRRQHKVGFARAPMQLVRSVVGLPSQILPTRICVEIVRWTEITEMHPVAAPSTIGVLEELTHFSDLSE